MHPAACRPSSAGHRLLHWSICCSASRSRVRGLRLRPARRPYLGRLLPSSIRSGGASTSAVSGQKLRHLPRIRSARASARSGGRSSGTPPGFTSQRHPLRAELRPKSSVRSRGIDLSPLDRSNASAVLRRGDPPRAAASERLRGPDSILDSSYRSRNAGAGGVACSGRDRPVRRETVPASSIPAPGLHDDSGGGRDRVKSSSFGWHSMRLRIPRQLFAPHAPPLRKAHITPTKACIKRFVCCALG